GNVEPILAAAGAAPALAAMPAAGRPASKVASIGEKDTIAVPVVRLDAYFVGKRAPNVMKVDVEGFELEVLRGAEGILRSGPALFVELHESMADFGASPRDVLTILFDHGYTVRTASHRAENVSLQDVADGGLPPRLRNRMVFCERGSAA
ncbi:MAG: FkbM family methyltransferase, partial [Pseudomonadota bacterium]